MRLIDADELKKYSYRTDWNVPVVDVADIDNAPTVTLSLNLDNITEEDIEKFKMIWQRATSKDLFGIVEENDKLEDLISELTDQICDLIDYMDSKDIFVWIDENGDIHECRSKEEREAEYKAAWLKHITEEKDNEQ